MKPSIVTSRRLPLEYISFFGLPKNPSHAALSGVHPFFDIGGVRFSLVRCVSTPPGQYDHCLFLRHDPPDRRKVIRERNRKTTGKRKSRQDRDENRGAPAAYLPPTRLRKRIKRTNRGCCGNDVEVTEDVVDQTRHLGEQATLITEKRPACSGHSEDDLSMPQLEQNLV